MKVRSRILHPSVVRGIIAVCAAACVVGAPSTTLAAGVVGTGSAASCTDAALNAALAGGGLVTFNCGPAAVTIDISAGTGTKTIATDTTVDGGGLITISGGGSVGVFSVETTSVTFTIQNLTIANGVANDAGGGIYNEGGALTVTNSSFAGNRAGVGGGIFNRGALSTLTVTNSTFLGNDAESGGGIYNDGTLTITNSTFSSNVGSGIANGGTLTITNSTFSDNAGYDSGGGIYNDGTLTVTNSTFSGNIAPDGGGIAESGGTLTVTNSTFSGNQASYDGVGGLGGGIYGSLATTVTNSTFSDNFANDLSRNCFGPVTDGGHNIDDGTTCGFTGTGCTSTGGSSFCNTTPLLDPAGLQSNGGPTDTVALCTAVGVPAGCTAASPAIDAGDQAICAAAPVNDRDQRGFGRPGTGHTHCSIGAYEADGTAPEPCAGDCDAGGTVTVDELITLVNITLGNAQASPCPSGIPSGAEVDIALIVQAVNHALSGCPSSDLYVAAAGALNGDGSVANPYRRITDAVARARAERQTGSIPPQEEIRIHVAPGTYAGSFTPSELQSHPEYEVLPIILNVPRLAVRGSTVLVRDDRGLPTASKPESETIVEAEHYPLRRPSLVLVTRTADGAVGDGVTVDGFVLDGDANNPLYVDRVSDFRISNNVIRGGSFGVTTRLASGTIEGNLLTHNGEAGGGINGGSIAEPATVLIHANRVTGGAAGFMTLAVAPNGALLRGSNTLEFPPLQTKFDRNKPEDVQNIPDTLTVTLKGNDISDYSVFGIRLFAVVPLDFSFCGFSRMGYETQDDTQPLTAILTATVLGNTITGNGLWGFGMEPGFPCRNDPRPFVVTFAGSFEGNSFAGNGRPAALFTFTRWDASITPSELPTYGFTKDSTYQVTDADGEFAGVDYDNPLTDPLDGATLNNTLTVNSVQVPHGRSVTPPPSAGISEVPPNTIAPRARKETRP